MERGEFRNWLELPPELTSSILHRLGVVEILKTAEKACRSWRDVCREASMWKIIDMEYEGEQVASQRELEMMCRHAIDRSQGGLVDFNIGHFGADDLLRYLADRSSNLKRLRVEVGRSVTQGGVVEAIMRFPLLEYFEIHYCLLSRESLKLIGQFCPNLKTLKLNNPGWDRYTECDKDALAIAESMPGLRHLQLYANRITDTGLNAILEKCLHLEHLDLRQCLNIKFAGNLEKRCSERIKVVRFPYDPTPDFEYSFLEINHLLDNEYY